MHSDGDWCRNNNVIVVSVVLRTPLPQLVFVGLTTAAVIDEVVRLVIAAILYFACPVPQ